LQKGQNGSKHHEPHFYKMRDEAVVRYKTQCLIQRAETRLKELVQVFDEDDGGALVDAAFDVHGD
jgi:hypothetical protein